MVGSDPSIALQAAASITRRRRAATWLAVAAAGLATAALALAAADAVLALGDVARHAIGLLWLAAGPAALAALGLTWSRLAPHGDGLVRVVEAACGDADRTLAQALDLGRRGGELPVAAATALVGRLPLTELPTRLPPGRWRGWLAILGGAVAVGLLTWAVAPGLVGAVTARWFDPYGDHPPWSQTSLTWAEAPERVRVRHAARVEVAGSGRPCTAPVLVIADGEMLRTVAMFPVGPQRWAAEIARVETPLILWAESGGTRTHRHALALDPVPELTALDLRLDQPVYARLAPDERRLRSGEQVQFAALAGAQISFRPTANRPLTALHVAREDGPWARITLDGGLAAALAEPGAWKLRLEAEDGALSDPFEPLLLATRPDKPPLCDFTTPSRDAFATPDSVVPFRAAASDDLGLAMAHRLREVGGVMLPLPDQPVSGRTWAWEGSLDLQGLGADPGDVITLYAAVRDTAPVVDADGRPGQSSAVAKRSVQVVSWQEYNQMLLRRLDVDAAERKYRPLTTELAELKRLAEELARRRASMPPDELAAAIADLGRRASDLAERVRGMQRPQQLFRFEGDLQRAIAEAAEDLAAGKTPRWDPEAIARDLEELTRRARGVDLVRRLGQLTDAEQNTVERLAPLGGHRRLSDGERLRLTELGQQEELLGTELGVWSDLARAWAERERDQLPDAAARMQALVDALEASGAAGLKTRAAAAARGGDGREAHRLAAEARDRLLDLLPAAAQCAGACAGGACTGMAWSDAFGDDLGGLMGAGGRWGLGGRGSAGMGLWLGYGGDDLGGTLPSMAADLFGPENLAPTGAERQGGSGDPIAGMASAGQAVGLGAAIRSAGRVQSGTAARATLGGDERRLVDDYFKRLEDTR